MYNQSRQYNSMEDPDRPPPQGAFPVWSKVFTKPTPQTFSEITAHPDATAKNAYIWVFIAGTLSGLLNSLIRFAVGMTALQQAAPEFNQLPGFRTGLGIGGALGVICTAPLTGVFAVIGFTISVAFIHWVAKFLGGQGSFDKLAYSFGAITTPIMVISAFLAPINALQFGALCTLPLVILLGLFSFYLQIAAVKGVHGFGWLEAFIAVILPVILLVFTCAFAVLGIMKAIGPVFNDVLQQLQ